MSAAPKRRPGFCHDCQRHDVEIESRDGKTLCDRCRSRATSASGSRSSPLYVVPSSSSLVPRNTESGAENQGAEIENLLREHAAGRIAPVETVFPALPTLLGPAARLVLDDFALVYGLRLWACEERPVPYATRWAAARIGTVTHMTVSRVLARLVSTGVLLERDPLPPRGGRRGTKTYLPGRATR